MTPAQIAAQIARFGNAQERDEACEILTHAGPVVVPALIAALNQPAAQFQIRTWAAKTLGCVGATATAAVPHLVALLNSDAHAGVRTHAAIALGKLGPLSLERASAHEALTTASHDPDATLCRKARAALEFFD